MILYLGPKEETEAWCLNPPSYATDSFRILTVLILYCLHNAQLLSELQSANFWRLTHVQKCNIIRCMLHFDKHHEVSY